MKLNFFNRQKKYEQYVLDGGLEYSSYYKDSIKRLKKNKMTMFCFWVIVLLILVAIFAPLIAPYDPNMQDYANILKAPSKVHLLGTDEYGRDILSRIIYGTRVSLSVGILAQVINLLKDMQKEMGMAYIFISHDFSVIKHISDRVAVMYLGRVMEIADKNDLYKHPMHPYTVALLSAIPVPDRKCKKEKIVLEGDLPSPVNPPSGCVFHTRCPRAQEICKTQVPQQKDYGNGHCCACHFPQE